MEYGKNILPTDAAYYDLVDATIEDNVLTVFAGGHAKYVFKESDISKMSEYVRVTLIPKVFADNYNPKTYAKIHVILKSGEAYNYTLFPVFCTGCVYTQELKFKAGEYSSFTFEIYSKDKVVFTLYEVCPESPDDDLRTTISGVEQSLPRLLYDYNKWPLYVTQQEKTIGIISYYLLDNTDLQGHLQMVYTSSSNCVLTLRIKDTYATELYAPLVYDIKEGRGSIGIPHAYLNRLKGNHNATVTAQVSAGELYLDVRGIMYTIDGGYLANRIVDVPSNVQDISLKQLGLTEPSEIWLVGVDAGEVLIKSRAYKPEKLKTVFESRYSLGKGKIAAIEFNGYWVLPENSDNYTLVTEENPYVFWTDENDTLWVQYGTDESTLVQLDTNVSQVKACRGYKSEKYLDQDQGLVCVYLKNGKAYYTQYIWDNDISMYRWTNSIELDPLLPSVKHVSVGRLNDYRIQITVITSTFVRSYITLRTYVNQAANPERAYLQGTTGQCTPIAYLPADYEISFKCIDTRLENDSKRLIAVFNGILELRWYHDISYYVSFNDSIPDYDLESGEPYVDSIHMITNPVQNTTVITVELNFKPLSTYTKMYLNADARHSLFLKLQNYGYTVCPTVSAVWDSTNYTSAEYKDGTLSKVPVVYESNINYLELLNKNTKQSDSALMKYTVQSNIAYTQVVDIKVPTINDAANTSIPYNNGIDYLALSDKPI